MEIKDREVIKDGLAALVSKSLWHERFGVSVNAADNRLFAWAARSGNWARIADTWEGFLLHEVSRLDMEGTVEKGKIHLGLEKARGETSGDFQ